LNPSPDRVHTNKSWDPVMKLDVKETKVSRKFSWSVDKLSNKAIDNTYRNACFACVTVGRRASSSRTPLEGAFL
jgi:hypothetical protein